MSVGDKVVEVVELCGKLEQVCRESVPTPALALAALAQVIAHISANSFDGDLAASRAGLLQLIGRLFDEAVLRRRGEIEFRKS